MYILDQEEGRTETARIQVDKNLSLSFFFFSQMRGGIWDMNKTDLFT